MKIEQQVCTLEQAKKLMALGVTAEPLYWHVIDIDPLTPMDIIQKWQHSNFDQCEKYPAYNVSELGVMLPNYYESHKGAMDDTWYCGMLEGGDGEYFAIEKTESEARAAMLIYLLENNLTTPEEVNQRLNN